MSFPTTAHFIYIPAVLILGVVLGFIWGARVAREAYELERKRQEEKARKKAEREAAKAEAAKADEPGAGSGPS